MDKQRDKRRLEMMSTAAKLALAAAPTCPCAIRHDGPCSPSAITYAPPPVRVGDHVECPACYGIGAVYSHTTGKTLLCACCRGNRNVKVEASS